MGCNCKDNISYNNEKFGDLTFKGKIKLILFYSLKIFGFMVGILLLPVINIAILWFMFNRIVLNKNFDVKEIVLSIMGKSLLRNNEDDDEDDDEDDYDDDEIIMLDVDEITHNIN